VFKLGEKPHSALRRKAKSSKRKFSNWEGTLFRYGVSQKSMSWSSVIGRTGGRQRDAPSPEASCPAPRCSPRLASPHSSIISSLELLRSKVGALWRRCLEAAARATTAEYLYLLQTSLSIHFTLDKGEFTLERRSNPSCQTCKRVAWYSIDTNPFVSSFYSRVSCFLSGFFKGYLVVFPHTRQNSRLAKISRPCLSMTGFISLL